MRLIALRDLKGKNQTIQKGAIFTLPEDKARGLVEGGYVQPFCYWLDAPVKECVYPCTESKQGLRGTERQCEHFRGYWAQRQVKTRALSGNQLKKP